jgi:nitroreductase
MELTTKIQTPKPADTDSPIHELLAHRWSPRMFSDQTIGREEMKVLLEAARWAASSNNEQPWRFVYSFKGSQAYEKIFNCISDFNQKWVRNAPVLILTAYKEKFDSGKENFHALHDLGLAIGNMSLQATSMGIALHSMAGVDWQKAQKVFGVPDGFHVTTAIAIGYYGGDPSDMPEDLVKMEHKIRQRKQLAAIASEEKWAF